MLIEVSRVTIVDIRTKTGYLPSLQHKKSFPVLSPSIALRSCEEHNLKKLKEFYTAFINPLKASLPWYSIEKTKSLKKCKSRTMRTKGLHGQRESKAVLEKQARLMITPGFA